MADRPLYPWQAIRRPVYSCDICGRRTHSIYAVLDGQWACGACAGPDPEEVVE